MTTTELIEKHGIGHNCLADAYELGRQDAIQEVKEIIISWSNRVVGNDSVKYISQLIINEIGEQCSNDRETKTCN